MSDHDNDNDNDNDIYITILNDDDDGRDNIEKSVYRIAEACEVQFQGQQQGKKVKLKQ